MYVLVTHISEPPSQLFSQSLYYTSDAEDGLSSSPSLDFTMHSGSLRGYPRYSPSNSSSDIPSESGDDTYVISADAFVDTGSGDVSYGTRPALHHSLSYTSGAALGPYTSHLESSSLPSLPLSGSHHSNNPSSFDGLYRLMPPAAAPSFSDVSMPPSHLFHPTDHYHTMEARIRSPVPYF